MEPTQISEYILYKNQQLIVFNKPAGLPVQADKTGDLPLFSLGEIYCKCKLYLLHRIDRPTSGIVVFAKTLTALHGLEEQFREKQVKKTYLAIVGNAPPQPEGTLTHYLRKEAKSNRSKCYPEPVDGGKKAVLQYRVLAASDRYHLLEIHLHTGRHHQIRAQLASIGCPIKGDVKYGFRRGNRDRSIHLHAWKFGFEHPVSGEKVELIAPLPDESLWNYFGTELE